MATVLVLGASGFIGRHLAEALDAAQHTVIRGVHNPGGALGHRTIAVDYVRDHDPAVWRPRLHGVDVVVNAVGILRENRQASFDALHVAAPRALFAACAEVGVRKVVQISALGADEMATSRYHVTKKRADDLLATLPLDWTIVQPSLVYGEGGASARLFTMLAAMPVIPLPGHGTQPVQPIHIDDLVAVLLHVIDNGTCSGSRVPAVGPRPLTFRDFLAALRNGMGLGDAYFMPVPTPVMRVAAAVGEHLPRALLDRESLGMLERGNVAPASAVTALLGKAPRGVQTFVSSEHARATANAARLAWLLPLLRLSVALVWIVTGIVSLGIYSVTESYALLARVGLTGTAAAIALYGAAVIDLVFGIGALALRRRRWLWRAQAALIVAYTIIITIGLPEFWLHPYGPLIKNLPMLAAILLLHEFEDA